MEESRDFSNKEQMTIVLHYVNTFGCVKEFFVGIVHVVDTIALSLLKGIEDAFTKLGLSFDRLKGQGDDGVCNMNGEYNGLKALVLEHSPSAYYVHCFAHQLQLILVAISKKIFNWLLSLAWFPT